MNQKNDCLNSFANIRIRKNHVIGVIFLRKPLFLIFTLVIICFLSSCSNKELNPANNEVPADHTAKAEISNKFQNDDEKTAVSIDTTYDYWSVKPNDSITLYVRKDVTDQKKVYIKNNDTICEYSWDYNLDYGEPLCQITKSSDGNEYLYVAMPTQPVESMMNDELYESKINGELHIISLDTLKEQPEWQVVPKINKLLSIHPGVKKVYDLTLDVSGYQYCYNFKSVENMDTFVFKKSLLVFNGSIGFNSFSDGIYANEQVGIKTGNKFIWLGVIQIKVNTNEPFEKDTSLGNHCGMNFKFYGYSNIRYLPNYNGKINRAYLKNLNKTKRTIEVFTSDLLNKGLYIDIESRDEYKAYHISKKIEIIGWDLEPMGTVYLTYNEFNRLLQAGYFIDRDVAIKTKGSMITGIYEKRNNNN